MTEGERSARRLHVQLLEAWNRRDAAAMAACLAPDGVMIGFDGSTMRGPEMVASTLATIFAHHPTGSYVGKVRSVRAVGEDASILSAVAGMVPAGQADLKPELNAVQTLVVERGAGGWRVVLFQNTPAAYHGRPEAVEALTAELRAALQQP